MQNLDLIKDKHAPDRLSGVGIPRRFHAKTLDTYQAENPGQIAALKWATEFARTCETSGASALLTGKPGTGKTHLAIGIALDLLLRNFDTQVRYTSVSKVVRRVKDSWGSANCETESDVRASLTAPKLLVLDEVGVQFGTEFEENLLFDIVNSRYEEMKPTILVSNVALDKVTEIIGERVVDRFREDNGRVLIFDWDSYRGKHGVKS